MASDVKSIAELGKKMDQLAKAIGGEGARIIARAMGEEAQVQARRAASADLGGDPAFSGWRRGAPIPLDTKIKELEPGTVLLTPTQYSAGPWTVAERGRGNSNAAGFSGPGANRKTGATRRTKKGNLRKIEAFTGTSRKIGHTRGKQTASDARAMIERALPPVIEREMSRIALQILGD